MLKIKVRLQFEIKKSIFSKTLSYLLLPDIDETSNDHLDVSQIKFVKKP